MGKMCTNNSFSHLGLKLTGLIIRDEEWVGEAKMDRRKQEKMRPLDRELTKTKEDKERKILDLLEKRVSGRRGQTQRQRRRQRERDDVVLSVFPREGSTAC